MEAFSSFLAELKRRRVYRTGIGYMAGAFVLWQVAEILVPVLELPEVLLRVVVIGSLAGLPIVLALSWAYDVVPDDRKGEPPGRRVAPGRAVALGIVAGLVTVAGLGVWLGSAGGDRSPARDLGSIVRVGVVPFETRGLEGVQVLEEGVVDLLYMALDGVAGVDVVEPRSSIASWRALGDEPRSAEELGRGLAESMGVDMVVLGRIVQAGVEVRVIAELRDREGATMATHQLDGRSDAALALVDELGLALLGDLLEGGAEGPVDIRALASSSPAAIDAYLRASAHFRAGRFDSATVGFQEAVRVDSTFALAYVGLADAYGWSGLHGAQPQRDAVRAAARHRDRLPPREARLVGAYALNAGGDPSAVDSMRAFVGSYPADARGWYALGDFQYHGPFSDRLSPLELVAPFDEALAIDSLFLPALIHPIEVALLEGDSALFGRYVRVYGEGSGEDRGFRRIGTALWGGEADARDAIATILVAGRSSEVLVGSLFRHRPDRVRLLVDGFGTVVGARPEDVDARYIRGVLAIATGRPEVTMAEASGLSALGEEFGQLSRLLRALAVLGEVASASETEALLDDLSGRPDAGSALFEAVVALGTGDVASARRALERIGMDERTGEDERLAAVRAWADVVDRASEDAVSRLREAVDGLPPPSLGVGQLDDHVRFELARVLLVRGVTRPEGLDRLRRLVEARSAVAVHLPAVRTLADALETDGEREEAERLYRRIVALLADADPPLDAVRSAAESALDRLVEGARPGGG